MGWMGASSMPVRTPVEMFRGLPEVALPGADAETTCGEGGPGTDDPNGFGLSTVMMEVGLKSGASPVGAAALGVRRVVDTGAAAVAAVVDVLEDVVT